MITKEQILERKNYIGGSDAPAILNMSRWESPIGIWMQKGEGAQIKEIDNLAIELGNELEDTVAKLFEKRTNLKTRKSNITIYHKKYNFIACHIDRKIEGEEAFLECKTTSIFKSKEWEGEEIPQEYIIQCQHNLMVTGYNYCYIAVLIGNREFKYKKINRDEELIKKIEQEEIKFWKEYVEKKQLPPIITDLDADNLSKIYPEPKTEQIIKLPNELNNEINKLYILEQEIKEKQKQIEIIKNILKAKIGDNIGGKTDTYILTWKLINKKEYIVPAKSYRELRKKIINQEQEVENE